MIGDQPIPQGKYLPAARHADLITTSGMTPRLKGELQFVGQVRSSEPLETYRAAVELATSNALIAATNLLQDGERIVQVFQLTVYVNAERGFTAHAALADFASEKIIQECGADCIGTRAAIGVATLPGDAPVEVALIVLATKN